MAILQAVLILVAVNGVALAAGVELPTDVTEQSIGPSQRYAAPAAAATPAAAPASPSTAATARQASYFSYTVRAGDSLGAIGTQFGVDVNTLAAANHLDRDAELNVGQVLRVPNPFAAQVRQLQGQIAALKASSAAAANQAGNAVLEVRENQSRMSRLTAQNAALRHGAAALPWWQSAAVGAGIAALLMLGVTLLALLEWWMMRRGFNELVEMNNSLRRLDYKYKSVLSKAELRFQQLYGRRRPGAPEPGENHISIPEEIEIERLDRELKEVLEGHLERLTGGRRRAKGSAVLGDVGEPAHVRLRR